MKKVKNYKKIIEKVKKRLKLKEIANIQRLEQIKKKSKNRK